MKIKFTLLFILTISFYSFSQEKKENKDKYHNKGFFNITRLGYTFINEINLETFSIPGGNVVTDLDTNKSTGVSLQTINGYFFNPHFSVGIGIGLDGYRNPTYNTLPVFLDARIYLDDGKSSPYAYINGGALVKIENGTNNGGIFNIGIGLKFPVNKDGLTLLTDLSFSYKAISNDGLPIKESNSWTQIKGTMLSIGILF